MQRRTTIWAAGLWSLLFGTGAHALSLGDIEVYSALNQPLEAEILLTSVRPGETEGMLIRLASEEAFAQAGVERPFYLTKIKFQPATKPDGTQYILATTDNPVREPFLSFLIDIDWPRGHLVREYTVLLDPPVFTNTNQVSRAPAAEALPAETLAEVADAKSAAGEPALIQRDEAAAAEAAMLAEELPDIEMIGESDIAQADDTQAIADQEGTDEQVFEEPTAGDAEALDAVEPSFEEDIAQDISADSTGIVADEAGDSILSTRLEQQALPDIDFAFDESLPYDAARTEALLAEFGITLDTATGTTGEQQTTPVAEHADGYKVQAGDTLWEIANRHKDADVSVQQAMLAILRYNPNGFIRDNINDVKKGFVLRMPEREAMLEVSRQEAAAEVQRQYALWREYRGELAGITSAQQDAVAADRLAHADTGASRDSSDTGGGQLSILAPGRDAESTTRSSGAQEGKEKGSATSLDLQLAREQLEAERLEKVELQSRLTDLTGQIETMRRLLTLKDEQLAKLQDRLRQLEAAAAVEPAATPTPEESKSKAEEAGPTAESPVVSDKATAEQLPLPEEQPIDITVGETPDPFASASDGAVTATTQPDTATSDVTVDAPALENFEKLNESVDKSLQSDIGAEPKVKNPQSRKPVAEVPPQGGKPFSKRLNAVLQSIQGFFRDFAGQNLPAPYNKMADDLLATPAGLGILAGLLILVTALLIKLLRLARQPRDKKPKTAKVIIGSPQHLETPPERQVKTSKFVAKKADLGERLKKVFAPFGVMLAKARKPKQAKAELSEDDEIIENEAAAAEEDLAAAVQEAAVEVKFKAKPPKAVSIADQGETVKVKAPPQKPNLPSAPALEEEISDDTTAEADVYLAYGLFDQAEELLKHALAANPGVSHYRGKLLETYFAAGKKDEFEQLAADLHKSIGNRPSRIWDKAIAMGKEIAPANPLFSGAADTGLKVSDFAPAKPATADLDLGEAGGLMTPDVDFGSDASASTALDLDISGVLDRTLIADSDETLIADSDSTLIADLDSTMIVDETSLDGLKPKDVTDSELNIDFDADDLGLGDDNIVAAEATMAMDIGLDIDNVDGITDVDGSGTFNSKSAGDDLIAELGGDDAELSLNSSSADTEFDLPEDDDTIIDAGDDTFSGDSGSELDEVSTKLDLAKAYMDMGDYDGASSTLEEVLSEGNDKQKREAEELLDQIN